MFHLCSDAYIELSVESERVQLHEAVSKRRFQVASELSSEMDGCLAGTENAEYDMWSLAPLRRREGAGLVETGSANTPPSPMSLLPLPSPSPSRRGADNRIDADAVSTSVRVI